jgi:hypothetical protein
MSFTSFADADQIVDRFIELLHRQGITPAVGRKIENEFLSPLQLLESTRNLGRLVDNPELLADAGGMYDLAAKVLAAEALPEFSTFFPHLKLFEAGEVFASAVQPKGASIRDHTNRKLAELYLGTLAAHVGFEVQLDDPVTAEGDNPDVMFRLAIANGTNPPLWALAIKTIHSVHGQTIFDNIKKAAAQIDAPACKADRGIVVVNLKNSLDHAALWRNTYESLTDAKAALDAQTDSRIAAPELDRSPDEWEEVFAGRASPLVLFISHAVVRLRFPTGLEVPTIFKIAKLASPIGRQDHTAHWIADWLNHYMQIILRGVPGRLGVEPS